MFFYNENTYIYIHYQKTLNYSGNLINQDLLTHLPLGHLMRMRQGARTL